MPDDVTLDNGSLTDVVASTRELAGGQHVQAIELVAVASGARADLAKAEDSVHQSGDYGLMQLAVRKDTATSLAGADGDYAPLLVDASGRVHMNVGSMPAAARTTDSIAAAISVDRLMQNLTALTPVHAAVDVATSGNNTLVAAQGAGNMILVHQVFLMAASTVTVRFESGADGTALTGQVQLTSALGFVLPFSPIGWFRTAANTLLNLELSAAVSVDGVIAYSVVT